MNTGSVAKDDLRFRSCENTPYLRAIIFFSKKEFNKVDFPTLGLPTKLTKPEMCPSGTAVYAWLSVVFFIFTGQAP